MASTSIANLFDMLSAYDDDEEDDTMATTTTTETRTMMAAQKERPNAVETTLHYLPDDREIKELHLGTAMMRTVQFKGVPMKINDVRHCDEEFTLEKNGFQFVKHDMSGSKDLESNDDERIESVIYQETEDLLKAATGATHVVCFGHLVRKTWSKDMIEEAEKSKDGMKILPPGPATHIHVDQSYDGSVQFLKDQLSEDEAAQLLKIRWGIINVWRPVQRPVTRDALAVCDYNSLAPSQAKAIMMYLPVDDGGNFSKGLKSTDRAFESWRFKHAGEDNEWYYCSEMAPDEALLIKCFDSKLDGRARMAPHSSFQSEYDHGPGRASLEVRCLVFWEDQEVE